MKVIAVAASLIALALMAWLFVAVRSNISFVAPGPSLNSQSRLTVRETDPYKGNRSAPITVIAVGSFTCPACKTQAAALDRLAGQYPQQVKVVWKDLPGEEEHSFLASVAARCAQRQGKFWQYHDKLFLKQDVLIDASFFTKWAGELGLKTDEFERCMANREMRALVTASSNEVLRLNVSSIPVTQVGDGEMLQGFQSYPLLKDMVNSQLAS